MTVKFSLNLITGKISKSDLLSYYSAEEVKEKFKPIDKEISGI